MRFVKQMPFICVQKWPFMPSHMCRFLPVREEGNAAPHVCKQREVCHIKKFYIIRVPHTVDFAAPRDILAIGKFFGRIFAMRKNAKRRALVMTQGSLFKGILLFSLPLVLSNVLQVLFNMTDVAVVGKFGSAGALGAVGSTTTYVSLFTGLLIGLGAGINVVIAQRIGAADEEGMSRAAHTAFIISIIYGVAASALAIGLARPILTLMGTKEEFLDGALTYIYIYFIGGTGTSIYNCGNGIFSADGNTRKPLIFLGASGAANVVLDLFFVIVCNLSVEGVAMASAIAQWLSGGLVFVALLLAKRPYRLRIAKLRLNGIFAKRILLVGVASGVQNAIFQVANLFIQAGINTFDSTVVEGNTAAVNADTLVFQVQAAFHTACTSFIGQNYGAGRRERILKCYLISLFYSFAAALVLGALIFLFSDAFLSLFTDDAAVAAAGKDRLSIMCFTYCLSAFMDCTIAAARGINKTVVPTIMIIFGSCIFRIVWVYAIFPIFGTTTMLYILFPVTWVITAVAEIIYFAVVYKKTVRTMAQSSLEGVTVQAAKI